MGTMIQRYKLDEDGYRGVRFKDWQRDVKGNNDLLVLTQPHIIGKIHEEYLEAGADILETNTFNAQRISMADYGMEELAYEMNVAAAKIARAAADKWTKKTPDKPRFVAGAVGPTNRTASISPEVNNPGFRNVDFDELREAYKEQVRGLIDGGADIILIETIFDTLNAKAAGVATLEVFEEKDTELPIMISGTITDRSGRTLSGQTPQAFWYSMRHLQAVLHRAQLRPRRRADAALPGRAARHRRCAHFGLSQCRAAERHGRVRRDAERYGVRSMEPWAKDGIVNIVGGCCGSTPDHIRHIAERVEAQSRRARSPRSRRRCVSPASRPFIHGDHDHTEMRRMSFINIGERTNVTGSAKFRKLIEADDYPAALAVAREPGGERRADPRRQHGRGAARFREGDADVPQPHRRPSPTSRACR